MKGPTNAVTQDGFPASISREMFAVALAPFSRGELVKYAREWAVVEGTQIIPRTDAFQIVPSPDTSLLALAGYSTEVYKKNGEGFEKILDENGHAYGCDFSPDGVHLVFTQYSLSPRLIMFKVNGTTLTRLPNPAQPPSSTRRCKFSPDGALLAVASEATPYITLYKRNGDTLTKLPNLQTIPAGAAYCCDFSSDGEFMAVGHAGAPYVTVYRRNGDGFVAVPGLNLPPVDYIHSCKFIQGSQYLVVAPYASGSGAVLKKGEVGFTAINTQGKLYSCADIAVSDDGRFVAALDYTARLQIFDASVEGFPLVSTATISNISNARSFCFIPGRSDEAFVSGIRVPEGLAQIKGRAGFRKSSYPDDQGVFQFGIALEDGAEGETIAVKILSQTEAET